MVATVSQPMQVTADTAIAVARATATVLGVALATGGTLGLGIVSLYAISLVTLELAADGRTEFVVVLLLVLLAGVAFVSRPVVSQNRDHSVGRPTLVTVTVLVFAIAFLLALLFAYPFVQDVVSVLAGLI